MRKGEIACNEEFLLFSQCFLPYMTLIFHFKYTFTLSQSIIFYSSKMKEFTDDTFKPDENGRKFSTQVENTVGKRRNCSARAISPFPTVFPMKFQLRGFVPLTTEKWGYKEKK